MNPPQVYAQPGYPQPQPAYPQPQPAYPQPQPVYPQPQPVYPQPQPVYPQPQPGYPQQPYTSPVEQPLVITEDVKKMFGFAHCIRILAIIEIVFQAISIFGLFFLAFPIAGKRISSSWNDADISCYETWRIILFVLACCACVGSIIGGQWASAGSAVVTAAIYYWIYWLVHQVKVLRSQIKASPESLAHGYTSTGAPLRLFYACLF
ncbi:hypothetical protein WA556_003603 [Blastocystis sp. ATCC 50177/Nand II]